MICMRRAFSQSCCSSCFAFLFTFIGLKCNKVKIKLLVYTKNYQKCNFEPHCTFHVYTVNFIDIIVLLLVCRVGLL